MMAVTATRSERVQSPGVLAQRLRKPSEKPTTTPIAVSEPLRKAESIVAGLVSTSPLFWGSKAESIVTGLVSTPLVFWTSSAMAAAALRRLSSRCCAGMRSRRS